MFRKVFLFSLSFLFCSVAFSQSPWVNKKGSIYGQISTTFLSYNQVFDTIGIVVESPFETSDFTLGLFADYSLTNNTAVIVDLPFKSVESNNESLSALGDLRLRIKHQLFGRALAVHYGYTAPISERNGILRTGYNQNAIELGLSIGKSKESFFTYATAGYKYRSNIPDQVFFEAELGFTSSGAKNKFYFILHLDGTVNTSTTQDIEGNDSALYSNNGDFISPGLKLSYNIFNNFWINLGGFGAMQARNQGAGASFTIGLAYNLKPTESNL